MPKAWVQERKNKKTKIQKFKDITRDKGQIATRTTINNRTVHNIMDKSEFRVAGTCRSSGLF